MKHSRSTLLALPLILLSSLSLASCHDLSDDTKSNIDSAVCSAADTGASALAAGGATGRALAGAIRDNTADATDPDLVRVHDLATRAAGSDDPAARQELTDWVTAHC